MFKCPIKEVEKDEIGDKSIFISKEAVPVAIKEAGDMMFAILFVLEKTEENATNKCVVLYIHYTSEHDKKFIKSHPMNYNNLAKNPERLSKYNQLTKFVEDSSDIYSTDFSLVQDKEWRSYYTCKAYRKNKEDESKIDVLTLMVPRSVFIKINLYMQRLAILDSCAETTFMNYKFNNVEYIKPGSITLDAACELSGTNCIYTHYTAQYGKNKYKFNNVSLALPKTIKGTLRKRITQDAYSALYIKDFMVVDRFVDFVTGELYVIYEDKYVTGAFKKCIALKLTKEQYENTNLMYQFNGIYDIEEEENKGGNQ